jgi:hypothetical protein
MSNPANVPNVVPFRRDDEDGRNHLPNLTQYEDRLKEFGLLPKEQQKFLEALWVLISGFVDLGYGVHPTQCPQVPDGLDTVVLRTVEQHFAEAA